MRCSGENRGVFREVRLAGVPSGVFGGAGLSSVRPDEARGVSVALPGGLRIEGLDLEGAAALARLLRKSSPYPVWWGGAAWG
jgi:hypothetical protein